MAGDAFFYLQRVPQTLQDLRRPEEHTDMCIMSARMHLPLHLALVLPFDQFLHTTTAFLSSFS